MDWWDLLMAAAGKSWACVQVGIVFGASLAVASARLACSAGLWLLGVATWPLTTTLGVLMFAVSPAVYLAQYAMSPVLWTIGVIPNLEALYIFFGCAACLGILAGTAIQLTSSIVATVLGMNETASSNNSSNHNHNSASAGANSHVCRDCRHQRLESEVSERSSVNAATNFNSISSGSNAQGRPRWGDDGFSSQASSGLLYWPTAGMHQKKQQGGVNSKRKGKQRMPGLVLQKQPILEVAS